jgi:hypothetical protein
MEKIALWVLVVDKLIGMFPRYIALWQWLYIININTIYKNCEGRDSSVSTETCYGLDGPGIECRCGRDFPHLSRPAVGPTQPPIQWVPSLFPGGKAAGEWRWPSTPFSTEVIERVELYLYSPSGPSWPVLGWLPLLYKDCKLLSASPE